MLGVRASVRSIANAVLAGHPPSSCPSRRVYSFVPARCLLRRFLSFLARRGPSAMTLFSRRVRHQRTRSGPSSMPLRSLLNDTPCPLWAARVRRHLAPRPRQMIAVTLESRHVSAERPPGIHDIARFKRKITYQ